MSDERELIAQLGQWEGYLVGAVGRWEAWPERAFPEVWIEPHPQLVHRCRVECPTCGVRLERLAWLDAHARVTKRLAESVASLCSAASVKRIAYGFRDDENFFLKIPDAFHGVGR